MAKRKTNAQMSFIQDIFEGNEDEKLRDLFDFYDTDGKIIIIFYVFISILLILLAHKLD